jgi:hypothetical protein
MKNVNKVLLSSLIISLAAAVVGCNSGSSSSSGPAAPNANPLVVPSGFTAGTTVGSNSPVLYNVESGQVALPNAAGYQVVQLPADVALALSTGNAYQTAQVTGASNGSVMISLPTVTYQIIPSTTTSSKAIASTAESYAITLTDASSNVVAFGGTQGNVIQAGVVYGGKDGNLYLNTGSGATSTTVPYASSCGVSAGDTITNITPATYNSSSFYAIGTANGVVCILSGSTGTWKNMSSQAPTTGDNMYTPGSITNLGFYGSGNSLLGFWTVANTGGNVVYQVNGTYSSTNGYTGNAFWNLTKSGNQSNNSGSQTINVSGIPASINSTTTDTNGNLWAGSTNGNVYVLRTGSTQWTATQLVDPTSGSKLTGTTTVFQTTGTGASVTTSGSTVVYSVQ